MNGKILIIGNRGSGAYLAFKHMILKEDNKSILIDDVRNKKLIKKLDKSNFDSVFYEDRFEEEEIVKNKEYKIFFFNCPGMNIVNSDILLIKNLVLRIGLDDLFELEKENINNLIDKFDKIFIFTPARQYVDEWRSHLKVLVPSVKKYVDNFNGNDISEYILISNKIISCEKYYIETDLLEKLFIK